jgi:hypothetical protein
MNLAFYSPMPIDACSFYRGAAPLSLLPGVDLTILGGQISWATLVSFDALWLQRPYLPEHLELLNIASNMMPVVVDYDDNMFHVPPSNPCFEIYNNEAKNTIRQLLVQASAIVVSTPFLANILQQQSGSPDIYIIPNAHNDHWFPTNQPEPLNTKIIYWRGSNTHQQDLLTFTPQIIRVSRDNPDWIFVFQGAYPWMLHEQMHFSHLPTTDPWKYHADLRNTIHPQIMIVPLEDNDFNRAKSNISWIEGTMAGAQVICPRWMSPTDHGYFDQASFEYDLRAAIYSPTPSSIELVPMLSQINPQRLALLESLV